MVTSWPFLLPLRANGIHFNVEYSKHVSSPGLFFSFCMCVNCLNFLFSASWHFDIRPTYIIVWVEIQVNSFMLWCVFFSSSLCAIPNNSFWQARKANKEIRRKQEHRTHTISVAKVPDTKWHNKIKVSPSFLLWLFVECLFDVYFFSCRFTFAVNVT